MTRDEAKAAARDGLEGYLQGQGIDTRRNFTCLNPEHEDKHPSMTYDRARQRVHCFACGATYDIFDLVGMTFQLDTFPQKLQKACALLGLSYGEAQKTGKKPAALAAKVAKPSPLKEEKKALDAAAYIAQAQARLQETDYFLRRGISLHTAQRFGLGYDPHFTQGTGGPAWQALIIPTSRTGPGGVPREGEDIWYTARNIDPQADKRHRIRKHGASLVYLADTLRTASGPIFIVEGELDALSVYEAGGEAIALGSVANCRQLERLLEQHPPQHPLLLALDNDEAGQRAAKELDERLTALGIQHFWSDICGEANDPNEALQRDREDFIAQVHAFMALEDAVKEAEREAYLATSAAHHLPAFLGGITGSVNTRHVPTGFAALDTHLDGGLYEGLYIIGAISSLGKTSLVLQMADQIAWRGEDVLIFSLEMARTELMAKSISRMTLERSLAEKRGPELAKTSRGITSGVRYAHYSEAERALIDAAVGDYAAFAGRLFIHEGIGDIGAAQVREQVRRHIEATGRTPVVIIDYLQILAPYSDRATDKQNTDKAVLELKRVSRDFKLPLIGISSFNRASYREAVTMEAFKESGAIEYSSDVLIGLQLQGAGKPGFDATAEKDKNPREVELVILKNRNGPTGKKVNFAYYPMFNHFREKG